MDSQIQPMLIIGSGTDTFAVSPDTGEICAGMPTTPPPQKTEVRYITKEVGTETPWPSLARDTEELSQAIQVHDWWMNRLVINTNAILELLGTGLTASAVQVFHYLAQNNQGRAYWFGSLEDLIEALQMPERTLKRALKCLCDKGLIERKAQGTSWPMRIALHPWYAWKGDLTARDNALKHWVNQKCQIWHSDSVTAQ